MTNDELVSQSILSGLKATGHETMQLVLDVLRTRYGFTLEDDAKDPVRLGKGLRGILGGAGARTVIDRILEDLPDQSSPPEYYIRFMDGLKAYGESLSSKPDDETDRGLAPGNVLKRPKGAFQVPLKGFPPDFTQKMVEAVVRGLSPLGDSGREAAIYLLEQQYNVSVTDAFTNPRSFLSGLTGMFGLGAHYLESSIIDEITGAFALSARPDSLPVAVREAGRKYKKAGKGSE